MGVIKMKKIIISLLIILMFASGCQTAQTIESVTDDEQFTEPLENLLDKTGQFNFENSTILNIEQVELITKYMNWYYMSLSNLNIISNQDIFENESQTELEKIVLQFEIDIRSNQLLDYSLVDYSFSVSVFKIELNEENELRVLMNEDSIERFASTSEFESKRFDRFHMFVLNQDEGTWKIKQHFSYNSLIYLLLQENLEWKGLTPKDVAIFAEDLLGEILSNQKQLRETEVEQIVYPTADFEYDRVAALEYAKQYINERNDIWNDYGSAGGNCQNFVSQALFASGMKMDVAGSSVWKYYSDVVNNRANQKGRSSSWTGVKEFLEYIQSNRGTGIVGVAYAPYYSGEIGDIIQLGTKDKLRHSVLISELIKNEEGKTLDYLVFSNTQNLSDYPISLYGYSEFLLIKIIGYNE